MATQREMFRTDDRYDVWKCAKCGRTLICPAVPHYPPTCCGTGMWYQEGRIGATYNIDWSRPKPAPYDAEADRERQRSQMRDV